MAAGLLKRWLAGQGDSLLWVEYDDYAGRVFASDPPDWLMQATRFANTMGQARKVIRTQVISVDVLAPLLARAPAEGSALERAQAALADAAGRAFVSDALDALAHKFAAEFDLVLKLRAPLDVLQALGESTPGFDELDDLATACAGLLRALSDKPVAALQLSRIAENPVEADESDACEPLLNAAKHYGWLTATAVPPALLDGELGCLRGVDILLCAELGASELAARNTGERQLGGGLGKAFWQGDDASGWPPGQLLFGAIPRDAVPEQTAARCSQLPGGS